MATASHVVPPRLRRRSCSAPQFKLIESIVEEEEEEEEEPVPLRRAASYNHFPQPTPFTPSPLLLRKFGSVRSRPSPLSTTSSTASIPSIVVLDEDSVVVAEEPSPSLPKPPTLDAASES